MVKSKWIFVFMFYLVFPLKLFSQDVNVSSEADQYAIAGKLIQGTVSVTHDSSQKIDTNSFKLGEDPIKVEFVKEVKLSERSTLVITIFKFNIEPQKEGLQFLPPVTATVDGKEYTSYESTYQVGKNQ